MTTFSQTGKETYGIMDVATGALLTVTRFGFTKKGNSSIEARFSSKHKKTGSIEKVVEFDSKELAITAMARIENTIKLCFKTEENAVYGVNRRDNQPSFVRGRAKEENTFDNGVLVDNKQIVGGQDAVVTREFKVVTFKKVTTVEIS